MSNEPTPTPTPEPTVDTPPEQSFSQADVDRIVAERLKREREATRAKYADYDDLKVKAGTATTLEERVAEIERQANDSKRRAEVAEVANAKGLTPTQARRLVGETREELEADADVLLADLGAQKQQGNHVPREGNPPTPTGGDDTERQFARQLFAPE